VIPLDQILAGTSAAAAGVVVVFVRVATMCVVLPGFGEQSLSVRIKLVLALLLTAAVAPAVLPLLPPVQPDLAIFATALATETLAGLFLGLMLRLFVHAIQIAGAIAAQSTSLSQLMGQAGADPLPAMGHILTVAALALLMLTGFHVKAAAYVILSYDILPALSFPDPAAVAEAGRTRVGQAFMLGFTLAAPFVILSVLYNLTLGVINKAMPQLMVAFVGAPVITLGSIALLFVAAPFMLVAWLSAFEAFLAAPFR
jgi:flagellar biosynthetic protein FliR